MKQIVDKLNDIAKAIDENVELPTTDLIVDSLDAITRAYGGTPSESNLIVDKLEDIAKNVTSGGGGEVGKHYVIPEGTYSSVDMMGMLAIPFLNLYFYAPILYVNFDGNQYILQPSYNNIGTNGGILYSNDLLTIFVTPDYEGLGLYSGTVILPGDTVSTQHTISAYYLGDERYWQCVHPLDFSELYVWANTCRAGETDMTFVMERPSQGDYSSAIYRAITKERGGIQIGRFYGTSFIVNNKSANVVSVIGATKTGDKYYITNTGNLVYVNLHLPQ